MFSINLSTILVLSVCYSQVVLGQVAPIRTAVPVGPSAGAVSLAANLSPNCQAAAGGLLTSDFGGCSNVMGLVSVLGTPGSIVAPMNSWINGLCNNNPCLIETLRQADQVVSTGCSTDIQRGTGLAVALKTIVSNYYGVRDLLCTQYTGNSTFCIPFILGQLQSASGQEITVNEIASIISGTATPITTSLANVPSSTYCNDCGHALVTQSGPFLSRASSPGSPDTASLSSISNTCGTWFNDGKMPKGTRIYKNNAGRQSGSLLLAIPLAVATFAFTYLL